MKLGLISGYSGRKINIPIDHVKHAENLGYESIWTSEAYGSDAVTPAAWILAQTEKIKVGTAIMQMPARSPAMAAMTAMTLAELSGGRFIVGLGASGPQVVEGWHGVAYGKPVTRLKEYVQIMKQIISREGPAVFDGDQYQLPYTQAGSTGLGKPLKSILTCDEEIPIYAASITPRGVAAAAEVCDGLFPIWMDPEKFNVFKKPIQDGFSKAADKSLLDFDISPFVTVVMGDDVEQCMAPIRGNMALYIGGMGARDKNFYNNYTQKLGFEDEALKIQDLFLSGRKDEAMAAVPSELIDACHLIGPPDRIRERLQRWKEAGARGEVGTMLIGGAPAEALELIAEELL
ncbi:MAG TPA: LLM class F420-dependent oxidoreductase [Gammaproteobacteria bacterium]|nr:LLM class F420-dependent oxidoreductase [Gammaproteobacteria bacterium]|tara:strand:- start:966 stop:2003 length:1038 start_codon:yes stop_codon:yes gene_type:complete